MTLRGALLSFRVQRFETIVVLGAALLSVVVSAVVVGAVNSGGFAKCQTDDPSQLGSLCMTGIYPWLNRIARLSVSIVPVFPVVAGLIAGGPIVARELETGTARLAWSLGPSRLRWLGQRAVPILVLVALSALAIGLAAEALLHVLTPATNLDESFTGFRSRGLLVGVNALLVASIALAFGAILGRAVPTFILALMLVGGIGIAVDKVERELLTSEALIADVDTYEYSDANLTLDNRLRFADGTILTWEEAFRTHPELQNGFDETGEPRGVVYYIPGTRYHDVERREAAVLLALAAGFIVLASVTVVRRRPR